MLGIEVFLSTGVHLHPSPPTTEASAQVQGEVDQGQDGPAVLSGNGPASMEKDIQGQIASQSHTQPSSWAEGGLAGTPKGPGNSWDLCWKFLANCSCNLLVQLERCIFELQKAENHSQPRLSAPCLS